MGISDEYNSVCELLSNPKIGVCGSECNCNFQKEYTAEEPKKIFYSMNKIASHKNENFKEFLFYLLKK